MVADPDLDPKIPLKSYSSISIKDYDKSINSSILY